MATVYVTTRSGGAKAATLWVDSGSSSSHIDAAFIQSLGFNASSAGPPIYGYGGTRNTAYYKGITVNTSPAGLPLLQDAQLASGLGAISGGPDVLIGENLLKQGVLVQNHTSWSFTFEGPLPVHGAVNTSTLGVPLPTAAPGQTSLSGSLVNDMLLGRAYLGVSQNVTFPGQMMVDTGAFTSLVNGRVLRSDLQATPGPQSTVWGVGGSQAGVWYPSLYLENRQAQWLLVNATMSSGIGRVDTGFTPPMVISIGEDFLGHGEFWQVGGRWQAFLQPLEGPGNVAANQKPWWYPTYYQSNPGP